MNDKFLLPAFIQRRYIEFVILYGTCDVLVITGSCKPSNDSSDKFHQPFLKTRHFILITA